MPLFEVFRNLVLAAFGSWVLTQYGPPIVDRHFLPTISYVADSFLAIAPLPPPSTTLMPKQPPIAIAPTPVVLKTIFVEQATIHGTESSRIRATITAMHDGKGSRSHDDLSIWGGGLFRCLSAIFDWWIRLVYDVPQGILFHLRRLFDNVFFQISLLIAPVISWQLTKIHSQMILERITAVHETEIAGVNEESSTNAAAMNLLITALQGQIEAQGFHLTEVQAELSAKNLAEVQFKSEISKLTDRINEIAGLVAEANSRADTAELLNKTVEKKAKAARSDHDSALQKKENEVSTQKNAREKAAEDRDFARSELKAARAEAAQDKKRITKLEKQVTESAGLQDQLNRKDGIIGQKDGIIRRMRDEADRASKEARKTKTTDRDHLRKLQAQIENANKLREEAEMKVSRKEQESKAKDDKIEDNKASLAYQTRLLGSLQESHDKWRAAYEKEQAEAREAATKAQENEAALQKRVAQLEEQIQGISASSNVAGPNSDASPPQERSTSQSVVPFSGPRRPRYVPPVKGEIFAHPEARGLPADTPRGPKGGSRGCRGSGH